MKISLQEHSACVCPHPTNEREAQRRQSLAQGHAGDRSCGRWFLSRTPLPTRSGRSNPHLCVRGRAHPPAAVCPSSDVSGCLPRRRALSRERQGVRSAPRPPAAASPQRLRPPQPVRGSRGGKGAAVGPALGARLAGSPPRAPASASASSPR